LGVDVIWFMPIHPIGQRHRKGSLGCPYSIRDYREVNPEYGTFTGSLLSAKLSLAQAYNRM
jgi:glycosidase